MFNPSREEARRHFFECWRKYRAREPLSGIEAMMLEVLLQHPEYHSMLDHPDRFMDRDFQPEAGETNPFLHLSMHLAINEQLSIDQPPGIRSRYQQILGKLGDEHQAQHSMMECLAEMIWQAQRQQTPPDANLYLECLEGRARK